MWYKSAASIRISLDIAKYNEFLTILQASPNPRLKFRELWGSLGEMHPDREALQEAFKATKDQPGSNANQTPNPNPSQKPNTPPAPNTTDKDLIPLDQLEKILQVEGLDAILVGPYDLSASMGKIGQFETIEFINTMNEIKLLCARFNIACGVHVVMPDVNLLQQRIAEGYRFLAYSIDSVFLSKASDLQNWPKNISK
jgi:hypothetical protein